MPSGCAPRASSTTSPTSAVSSSSSSSRSRTRRVRSSGGRPFARASTCTFVRRLESGVRSSCEASATSCRWEATELSSASSVVLKLRARRPSSSSPSTTRRWPSGSSVTTSVLWVKRRTGESAVRETIRPSPSPSSTPAAVISASRTRSELSAWSVSVSGRAICTATPFATGIVSTRRWTPAACSSARNSPRVPAAASRAGALTGSDCCPGGGSAAPVLEISWAVPPAPPKRPGGRTRGPMLGSGRRSAASPRTLSTISARFCSALSTCPRSLARTAT